MHVKHVENHFHWKETCSSINVAITKVSKPNAHSVVIFVRKILFRKVIWSLIVDRILVKNHLDAVNVAKHSSGKETYCDILRKLIQILLTFKLLVSKLWVHRDIHNFNKRFSNFVVEKKNPIGLTCNSGGLQRHFQKCWLVYQVDNNQHVIHSIC